MDSPYAPSIPIPLPETHRHYFDTDTRRRKLDLGGETAESSPVVSYFMVPSHVPSEMRQSFSSRYGDQLSNAFEKGPVPIPNELLWEIFKYLARSEDLRAVTRVCARWYIVGHLAMTEHLRKHPASHPIHLNRQQLAAYQFITKENESACVVGEAGCGKSCLLRSIDSYYHRKSLRSFVVAPTGIAARNVNGMTIHEFLGQNIVLKSESELRGIAGLGIDGDPQPQHRGAMNARAAHVLIIDEISMVLPELFAYLDLALRCYRRRTEPFGGVQLVCFGDFGQLAPVGHNAVAHNGHGSSWFYPSFKYCFELPLFQRVFGDPLDVNNPNLIYLCAPMRHARDAVFLDLLMAFRGDMPSQRHKELLEHRTERALKKRAEVFSPSVLAVAHRDTARSHNETALQLIQDDVSTQYHVTIQVHIHMPHVDEQKFIKDFLSDRGDSSASVELKRTARVFLLVNIAAHGLYNKCPGTVCEMINLDDVQDAEELRVRLTDFDSSQLKRSNPNAQFHLVGDNTITLCWDERRAMSSLASAWALAGGVFSTFQYPRMAYCGRADLGLYGSSQCRRLPVVEFDSQPNCFYLILPCTRDYLQRNEDTWVRVMSLTRMPLELAYAQTFHALQGLTLDRIRLDLAGCWEPEQVYVGLSRVHALSEVCIKSMPSWHKLYGRESASLPPKRKLEHVLQEKKLLWCIEEKRRHVEILAGIRAFHSINNTITTTTTITKKRKKKETVAITPKRARSSDDEQLVAYGYDG